MEGGRKGERARKERGMSEGEERDGREEGGKGGNREKIGVHVWQGVREGDVKWVERERREDGAEMEYDQVKWRRRTVIAALLCETAQCLI